VCKEFSTNVLYRLLLKLEHVGAKQLCGCVGLWGGVGRGKGAVPKAFLQHLAKAFVVHLLRNKHAIRVCIPQGSGVLKGEHTGKFQLGTEYSWLSELKMHDLHDGVRLRWPDKGRHYYYQAGERHRSRK
jgi:hypothetical protein